jgi:hypothetical protein
MPNRYVTVRVVNSSGSPVRDVRVNLYPYQFGVPTDHSKSIPTVTVWAEFELDLDQFAEISISVNGTEMSPRGSIRASFKLTVDR